MLKPLCQRETSPNPTFSTDYLVYPSSDCLCVVGVQSAFTALTTFSFKISQSILIIPLLINSITLFISLFSFAALFAGLLLLWVAFHFRFVLNVARDASKVPILLISYSVGILDQLEVEGVEPQQVIVSALVASIVSALAVERHIVVSEEEVERLDGGQGSVHLAGLVPPEGCLLSLNFDHLQGADLLRPHVVPCLCPGTVDQHYLLDRPEFILCHGVYVYSILVWEEHYHGVIGLVFSSQLRNLVDCVVHFHVIGSNNFGWDN
jgi:hypothetical protein